MKIYKSLKEFLAEIFQNGKAPYERSLKFYSEVSEAYFLFDKGIQDFLDEIYKKAIRMQALEERMYSKHGAGLPVGSEREKVANENGEILKWILSQGDVAKDKFKKYLQIK